jgi:hypothetical protein
VEDLRGHGLAVPVTGADEAEHRRAVAGQCLPEFCFDLSFGFHAAIVGGRAA